MRSVRAARLPAQKSNFPFAAINVICINMKTPVTGLSNSLLLSAVLVFGSIAPATAALNAYAELTLNGTALSGDTTMASIGGVDVSTGHIECFGVHHEMFKAANHSAQTTHAPFKLIKRVDKASPLLYQALAQNQNVAGTIKYFRTSPEDGSTQLYFTITFSQARVNAIRHWSPNNLDAATSQYPQMEEVSISYNTITFTETLANVEAEISVNQD